MTLDEYITRHCAEYAAALEKLASASVENKVIHDMNGLVKHLRSLYRVRRSAFPTYLLEKIKKFSTPGSNPIIKEPLEEKVEGPSKEFEVGKYYLSQHGVFRVTGFGQFPSIDPPLYPKCKTLYFKSYMLEQGSRSYASIINHHRRPHQAPRSPAVQPETHRRSLPAAAWS